MRLGAAPPSSGKTPKEQPFRQRAFTVALPLATAAAALTYIVELARTAADPFNLLALPILAALFSVLTAAHVLRSVPQRWIEAGFFLVTSLAFFSKLGFTLLGSYDEVARLNQLSQVYIWTPFIYVLAFLVGRSRTGLQRAIAVYLIGLVIGLASLGSQVEGERLIEYYLSNAVLLTLLYFVSTMQTQLGALQGDLDRMEEMATQDFLTGVPNRRRLEAQLHIDLEQNRRYGTPLSVILFDIDNFKRFNDTFGHEQGDKVLQAVARAVQDELRTTDAFGRWGGEEFLVVASHTRAPDAVALAERLRKRVERAIDVPEQAVTASFGVASYAASESLETLLSRADEALYLAKAAGKNRVAADRRGGLPEGLQVPELEYPFAPVLTAADPEVVADVASWLERFDLGPAPAGLRGRFATTFCSLACTLHPNASPVWQLRLSKWYCWAFLHDDRCDATELGYQPTKLKALTDRLLEVFAGAATRPGDEPLAQALADLRREFLVGGSENWVRQVHAALAEHFKGLLWEARNRASGEIPSLDRYLEMRPVTAGLLLDELFVWVDGVTPNENRQDTVLAARLSHLANEVVCWANDLLSLDKELRHGDSHNLVLVLQESGNLSLAEAIHQAERHHSKALARYLEAETEAGHATDSSPWLELYSHLLRTRMRGIHDWGVASERYG